MIFVYRDSGVSLKGRISQVPERLCWLYALIVLKRNSPLPKRYYWTENWLSSRCPIEVIVRELVFPSWHHPLTWWLSAALYFSFLPFLWTLGYNNQYITSTFSMTTHVWDLEQLTACDSSYQYASYISYNIGWKKEEQGRRNSGRILGWK